LSPSSFSRAGTAGEKAAALARLDAIRNKPGKTLAELEASADQFEPPRGERSMSLARIAPNSGSRWCVCTKGDER
jgi:hypothetical protein